MSHVELPVYLIAWGDKWLAHGAEDAALAFGTEGEALERVLRESEAKGVPPAAFRIVEFRCTGNVREG